MALNRCATAPGKVGKVETDLDEIPDPGALMTNLYDKMLREGKIKDKVAPLVRPAGRSITVPLADSAERDLQSEIYFPTQATPIREKRFRRLSSAPGEIIVHHSLKDQLLPGEEFRYGVRGTKGSTTEQAMKAGQLMGVAEFKSAVCEQVYESVRKEPLGRPLQRGYSMPAIEAFGTPSGIPQDLKYVVSPVDLPQETEAQRSLYRKSHNNYLPGERISRNYTFPSLTQDKTFRFGGSVAGAVEGRGARLCLNEALDDDGAVRSAKLVTKVNMDYRNVGHPKLYRKTNLKQGPVGGNVPLGHRYGIKSTTSDYTAKSCITGYYSLEEQLPDQDLGHCTKPGRRNVTTETRAFGLPSVRTDIPAPPAQKRSMGDSVAYGDEPSVSSILTPQRFSNLGIDDSEFLVRRSKDELEGLTRTLRLESFDFEALWGAGLGLFDDDIQKVSLDAILYLHAKNIEDRVGKDVRGLHLLRPL